MDLAKLIPHDKALHGLAGVLIFAIARAVSIALGGDQIEVALAGMAAVAIAACAKEAYDLQHRVKHTPDLRDAAATAFGGLLAVACCLGPF